MTHRYFGTDGAEVKKTRLVKLLPLRQPEAPEPPVPASTLTPPRAKSEPVKEARLVRFAPVPGAHGDATTTT